jgi:hemerythrin superfamily protein
MEHRSEQNVVNLLKDQHDDIRQLFQAVAESSGEARREAFEPLVRLLAVHETAEEMVVYPTLHNDGEDAKRVADARIEEEDEAKKMLAELEKLEPDSAEFDAKFIAFRTAVEEHAASEEREVFPLLERITDAEELDRMASALELAEGVAPTHAHKTAPTSALGNMLVGPFVAMVDRTRDAIRDATR